MSFKFNVFTSNFDEVGAGSSSPYWLPPVANEASLPTGDADGAARVVLNTELVYTYDLASDKWRNTGLSAASFSGTATAQGLSISTSLSGSVNTPTIALTAADATHPGGVSTSSQTFGGAKTFNGVITAAAASTGLSVTNNASVGNNLTVTGVSYTDGGIDTSTPGTLSIGTVNASIINLGNASATINFNGTVNNNNVTNLNVADQLITINDGGGAGSGSGSGFEIEEASVATGYVKTSGDRNSFLLKAPNTAGIATITPGAGGITLDQSSHDPVTLGAVGSSPNGNAASLSTQVLTLQPADGTNPGVITAGTQTIGGNKTFNGSISASNLSGTNTGDVTISDTNSIDLSLTGQLLSADVRRSGTTLAEDASGIKVATQGITNNEVSNTAAIARTKIASGTANHVIINDGAGVLSSEAVLAVSRGGTETNSIPSNGQLLIGNGTNYSVANLSAGSGISITNGSGSITVASSVPPSTGDIAETSFSAANNQASPTNVTGLTFSNASVRSFNALVSVAVDATSDLFEVFELRGIQRGSDWQMSATSTGDNSGFSFSITTAGQVQYTNSNYSGFVSATLKFRAIVTQV